MTVECNGEIVFAVQLRCVEMIYYINPKQTKFIIFILIFCFIFAFSYTHYSADAEAGAVVAVKK